MVRYLLNFIEKVNITWLLKNINKIKWFIITFNPIVISLDIEYTSITQKNLN